MDTDRNTTRFIRVAVHLGAAVFVFHTLFFALALVVQPPHWTPRGGEAEASSVEALSRLVSQDMVYRGQVASFFLVMALLGIIFGVLICRDKRLMNWFGAAIWFSFLSFAFSFFSTRGRQWYFEFGTGSRWDDLQLVAVSALCFALFVGTVAFGNRLERTKIISAGK